MAIKRSKTGAVEFEGAVLSQAWTGSSWLCSDYGLGIYCEVWNGTAVERITVGVSDIGPGADYRDEVVVDATPEVLAAVAAWRKAKAEAEAAERARIEFERIAVGRAVVVARGRKVAKGTKGVVAWMGSNQWGQSVGLRVEGVDGLVFTSLSNVDRDLSGAASEMDAAHDSAIWYDANVYAAKAALKATGVAKGDKVTPKSGAYAGQACRVIWAGTRQGQARVGVVPTKAAGRPAADWLPVEAVC